MGLLVDRPLRVERLAQEKRSGKSTPLQPIWPGFESRRSRNRRKYECNIVPRGRVYPARLPWERGSVGVLSLLVVLAYTRSYSIPVPRARRFMVTVVRYKLNRVALGTRMPFFWSIFPQRSTKDFPSPQKKNFQTPI